MKLYLKIQLEPIFKMLFSISQHTYRVFLLYNSFKGNTNALTFACSHCLVSDHELY
jgi:hypothetical protein